MNVPPFCRQLTVQEDEQGTKRYEITIDKYSVQGKLAGCPEYLMKCKRIGGDQLFVAKRLNAQNTKRDPQIEVDIVKEVSHDYIVHTHDFIYGVNNQSFYLIMEYMQKKSLMTMKTVPANGEATYTTYNSLRRIEATAAKKIIKRMLLALQHIHEKRIAHRDMKPENLFVDADGNVKLGDFGISERMEEDNKVSSTPHGTPGYIPVEVFKSVRYDGSKGDVFSLGFTYYVLLTGELPFGCYESIQGVQGRKLTYPNHIKGAPYLSFFPYLRRPAEPEFQILQRMMNLHEPSNRPSVTDLLEEDFFSSVTDI